MKGYNESSTGNNNRTSGNRKAKSPLHQQTSSLTPLPPPPESHRGLTTNTHKSHYTTTLSHNLTLSNKQEARSKLRYKAEQAALKIREQKENSKQAELLKKHTDVSERSDIWRNEILPYWHKTEVRDSSRVKDLCYKGVPPNIRGQVWPLMIDNKLELSSESFSGLRLKADLSHILSSTTNNNNNAINYNSHNSNYHDDDNNTTNVNERRNLSDDINTHTNAMYSPGTHTHASASAARVSIPVSTPVSPAPPNNFSRSSILMEQEAALACACSTSTSSSLSTVSPSPAASCPMYLSPAYCTPEDMQVEEEEEEGQDMYSEVYEVDRGRGPEAYSRTGAGRGKAGGGGKPRARGVTTVSSTNNDSKDSSNGHGNGGSSDLRQAFSSLQIDLKLPETVALIEFDLPRTFPTLGFFHNGGPLQSGLDNILTCYAHYKPEIGYVQGMSYLAAMLLLYMDEDQAFICLANLIDRRGNLDFYGLQRECIESHVSIFDDLFKKHLPLLYNHMMYHSVASEMYLLDWHLSLFTKVLPLEAVARIWDVYLYEGEIFLIRTALGVLRMFAPRLCLLSLEEIMQFLKHLPDDLNIEILLDNIKQIHISTKKYESLRNKYIRKNSSSGLALAAASLFTLSSTSLSLGMGMGMGSATKGSNNNNNNVSINNNSNSNSNLNSNGYNNNTNKTSTRHNYDDFAYSGVHVHVHVDVDASVGDGDRDKGAAYSSTSTSNSTSNSTSVKLEEAQGKDNYSNDNDNDKDKEEEAAYHNDNNDNDNNNKQGAVIYNTNTNTSNNGNNNNGNNRGKSNGSSSKRKGGGAAEAGAGAGAGKDCILS